MNTFELIYNDKSIQDRYKKIELLEDETEGWAYHNWFHATNVMNMTEDILQQLNVSQEYLEAAKIAAILHDVGADEGKDGHALRGKKFAKEYFNAHNLYFPYKKEALNAIENHRGGFDSSELMTLSLILSDKLDITKSRVAKAGYQVEGMRQLQFIKNISLDIKDDELKVIFSSDSKIDYEELNNFYFIHKVFKAIQAFSNKIQRTAIIEMNGKTWDL